MRTLLVVIAFLAILATSQLATVYAIAYFPPPLKQIRSGTLQENVTCTEGLELVFKSTNGSPACVKSETAEELIERGWANPEKNVVIFFMDKEEYEIGEEIAITMKNVGTSTLHTGAVPVGFVITNEKGELGKNFSGHYEAVGSFQPGQKITHTWDQKNENDGSQAKPGTYKVSSAFFDGPHIEKFFKIVESD